jgi:hypothetical protein
MFIMLMGISFLLAENAVNSTSICLRYTEWNKARRAREWTQMIRAGEFGNPARAGETTCGKLDFLFSFHCWSWC